MADRDAEDIHILVMRSPREHVAAQFLECAHSKFGRKRTAHAGFPRGSNREAFAEWVGHLSQSKTFCAECNGLCECHRSVDFGCYDAHNFQARALCSQLGSQLGS